MAPVMLNYASQSRRTTTPMRLSDDGRSGAEGTPTPPHLLGNIDEGKSKKKSLRVGELCPVLLT